MKYKRPTVNIPEDFWPAIAQRRAEAGYSSFPAYVIGLIVYDLWSRREHTVTAPLMREDGKVRDASIQRIADDYMAGKRGKEAPCYFDRYVKEIVEEEIRKAKEEGSE